MDCSNTHQHPTACMPLPILIPTEECALTRVSLNVSVHKPWNMKMRQGATPTLQHHRPSSHGERPSSHRTTSSKGSRCSCSITEWIYSDYLASPQKDPWSIESQERLKPAAASKEQRTAASPRGGTSPCPSPQLKSPITSASPRWEPQLILGHHKAGTPKSERSADHGKSHSHYGPGALGRTDDHGKGHSHHGPGVPDEGCLLKQPPLTFAQSALPSGAVAWKWAVAPDAHQPVATGSVGGSIAGSVGGSVGGFVAGSVGAADRLTVPHLEEALPTATHIVVQKVEDALRWLKAARAHAERRSCALQLCEVDFNLVQVAALQHLEESKANADKRSTRHKQPRTPMQDDIVFGHSLLLDLSTVYSENHPDEQCMQRPHTSMQRLHTSMHRARGVLRPTACISARANPFLAAVAAHRAIQSRQQLHDAD